MRGVAIALLLVLLVGCSSGINFQELVDNNPGALVTINKLEGDNLNLFITSLQSFCPDLDAKEIYRVQITTNKTITQALDTSGDVLCEVDTSDPEFLQKSVAISVNGEPIYLSDVQASLNAVPEQQRAESTPTVLNNLINQKLLEQKAEEQGIRVTGEQIDQAIDEANLELTQVAEEDLGNLRAAIARQIKAQTMLGNVLQDADPTVMEEDAKAYYEENKADLQLPESWSIRHIQILFSDRGEQADFAKAQTVFNLLDSTDFCDLVTQFSDDTTSIENCGRYTFTTGQMHAEIESEVKEMQLNEKRVAKSQAAYHIIELESVNPARQATYFEVKDQIRNFLLLQKRQEVLNAFINGLRENAEIISYVR